MYSVIIEVDKSHIKSQTARLDFLYDQLTRTYVLCVLCSLVSFCNLGKTASEINVQAKAA